MIRTFGENMIDPNSRVSVIFITTQSKGLIESKFWNKILRN